MYRCAQTIFCRGQSLQLSVVLTSLCYPCPSLDITFQPTDAEKTITSAYISSVPSASLSGIDKLFKEALAHEAEYIDMERMRVIIERGALKIANQFEVEAHETLSTAIISNFLYGSNKELEAGLSTELQRYNTLASWSKEQWTIVFKEFEIQSLHFRELQLTRSVCLFRC